MVTFSKHVWKILLVPEEKHVGLELSQFPAEMRIPKHESDRNHSLLKSIRCSPVSFAQRLKYSSGQLLEAFPVWALPDLQSDRSVPPISKFHSERVPTFGASQVLAHRLSLALSPDALLLHLLILAEMSLDPGSLL